MKKGFSKINQSIAVKTSLITMVTFFIGLFLSTGISYKLFRDYIIELESQNVTYKVDASAKRVDERAIKNIITQMTSLSKDVSILEGIEKENRLNSFLNQNRFFHRVLFVRNENVQEAYPLENGKVKYKKLYEISELKAGISEVYREEGKPRILSVGIRHDDSTMLVVEIDRDKMSNEFFAEKIGTSGYYYVTEKEYIPNADGKISRTTYHPKSDKIDAMAFSMFPFGKDVLGKPANVIRYIFNGQVKYCAFTPGLFAIYAISIDEEEFLAPLTKIKYKIIGVSIVMYLLTFVIGYFGIKRLVTIRMISFNKDIASVAEGNGDLSLRVKIKYDDELGQAAKSYNQFLDFVEKLVRDLQGQVRSLSILVSNSQDTSGELMKTSKKLNIITSAFSDDMRKVGSEVVVVRDRTSKLANGINEVTVAVEQMSSAIREISINAERGRIITEQADKEAKEVGEAQKILMEAVQQIGAIIESINDISDKTNLLALNATIEAARAGAAGKGFAVVAGEIKELSKQTSEATKEIEEKIKAIEESSDVAIGRMSKIISSIADITEIVGITAASVEEQTAATREIAEHILGANSDVNNISETFVELVKFAGVISSNVTEIDNSSNQIKNIADKTTGVANELKTVSGDIDSMIGGFTITQKEAA